MLRLYGFNTQNSLKALYVLEESGIEFEFEFVDLGKGEQKSEEFRAKTLMGKVPLLEQESSHLGVIGPPGLFLKFAKLIPRLSLFPDSAKICLKTSLHYQQAEIVKQSGYE